MQIQKDAWYFDSTGQIRGPMYQISSDSWACGDGYFWDSLGSGTKSPQGQPRVDLKTPLPFGVKGPCIKTCSGRIFNLLNSHCESVVLDDIAIPLSRIQRWGGQYMASVPEYSVAAHSLNCLRLSKYLCHTQEAQLAVLLHDAAEAYVGDLVKPLKMLCDSYSKVENRIQDTIAEATGCDFWMYRREVEIVDQAILVLEKNTIINGGRDWVYTFEDQAQEVIPHGFELLFYPRSWWERAWRGLLGASTGGCPVKEFKRAYKELGGL